MDLMTRRRALMQAAAGASGLRYDLSTVTFTGKTAAVSIPRKFERFVLIAEAVDNADPGNLTAVYLSFVYPGDWIASAGRVHYIRNATRTGGAANISQLTVSDTTIELTAYTTSNNALGDWNVLQIELPASCGIVPLG